jgi:radical SAM protein with 4Fe4S-binding SPASM domain
LARELGGAEVLKVAGRFAKANVFVVTLSGGEPLLKRETFNVIPVLRSGRVDVNLITNGTLVTMETARRLSELGIRQVQVSLDGSERVHDSIRGVSGSFTKTVLGVKNLLECGMNVCLSMVVSNENLKEVEKVLETARALGAQAFRVLRFIPMGRGKSQRSLIPPSNDMRNMVTRLLFLREENKGVLNIDLDENVAFLSEKERKSYDLHWSGCLAAKSEAAVDSSGNLYPCAFLEYPGFKAGNLLEYSLEELWVSDAFSNFRKINNPCFECDVKPCSGGCPAVSYALYGNLNEKDVYCWKSQSRESTYGK